MTRPGSSLLPASAPRWALPGLVIALLTGLVWMHALSAGHHSGADPAVADPAARHVTSIAGADQCLDGDGHDTCPIHPSEHPGPMCQSGAVPGAAATVTASSLPAANGRVDVTVPVPVSALTAPDAGGGSGCGPPSMTMLSISRT